MRKRSRIVRMDKWDISASRPLLKGGNIPLCDLSSRPSLHQLGLHVYFSHYKRTKKGIPFSEIKQSAEYANQFAQNAIGLLHKLVNDFSGWAIITTPRRRHYGGFHFATAVCEEIAESLSIPFYEDAVQCINRNRLSPQFHLLRPIAERKIIIYDDIITTGVTLTATNELLADREIVLNIIGISNR